ncbi:hypothetical protein D7D52_16095 [Nocardia yunnanensis]|uniref:Uncharacterized protein n=1 Tax=Nocardia yunnanensis TaxID=2382165 RepID=A0A386ZBA4_9NOCA|nr:hypothetical protein [Nocardia yunnanensis]AYF75132.1 hypothetical protein D7D52_16095 [Nocardia yunnanensis]
MFDQLTIGAWVITTADCPVRFVPNPQDHRVTLILGDTHREFEICLDTATLAAILRHGADALAAISANPAAAMTPSEPQSKPS